MSDELTVCQYCKSKVSQRRLQSHIGNRCEKAPIEIRAKRAAKTPSLKIHQPYGDLRYRIHKSVRFWVMVHTKENGKLVQCGVLRAIERVVFELQGKSGLFVRYDSRYFPLHGEAEFVQLLDGAKKEKYAFFHNEIYGLWGNPSRLKELTPSAYIVEGEAIGPCYNFLR
jgi:hypothetical protein